MMIPGDIEDRHAFPTRRVRFRLGHGAGVVLVVILALLIDSGYCMVTCWGAEGHFTYRQTAPLHNLGIGCGCNQAYIRLRRGDKVTFDYRANGLAGGDVSYYILLRKRFNLHSYRGSLDLKPNTTGRYVFVARDDGLHELAYRHLGAWTGEISVSWRVER